MSTPTARAWLETGRAPKERSAEITLGMVLLSGKVQATPELLASRQLGEDVELALLEIAEERADWSLVALLCAHARSKPCAKAARKAVFRAKQRGISVPEAGAPRRAVALSLRPDPLPSYCTAFDKAGHHVVALGGWSATDGGWSLAGVIGPDDQLRGVYFHPQTSRSKVRSLLDRVVPDAALMAEVPATLAAGLLRRGLDLAKAAGVSVEGDLMRAGRLLADVTPLETIECRLADDPAALLAAIDAGDRHARLPAVQAFGLALRLAHGLTAEASLHDVEAKLDADGRARWARRLEVMAVLLDREGDQEAAVSIAAAATRMRDASAALESIPLLRGRGATTD
ncbi:MAG: hypothetical protein H6747_02485 [Deltaproteobacteria bacterium]|nr:hypothetical protein [Deltaproteobacteria bacterium]